MLRWRVGRKVPINVYEGDRPVCQCHTVRNAQRIVDAMNRATGAMGGAHQKQVAVVDCEGIDPTKSRKGKISLHTPTR
jgi:hypothetical protein